MCISVNLQVTIDKQVPKFFLPPFHLLIPPSLPQSLPDPHQRLPKLISTSFLLIPFRMLSIESNSPEPITRASLHDHLTTSSQQYVLQPFILAELKEIPLL